MDTRVAKAKENFLSGYNCAQSVLLAFADPIGLTREQAVRLSSSFGAGMGRMREVCGALTSLFMIAGLACGYESPEDLDGKTTHYAHIQTLAQRFKSEMGSILCRDLLGEQATTTPVPDLRSVQYYASRPCLHAIECSAALAEEFLQEKFHEIL